MRSVKVAMIVSGVFVVILLILTLIISSVSTGKTFPTPTGTQANLENPQAQIAQLPTSFHGEPIPTGFFTQARAEYARVPTTQTHAYILTTIKNYYSYRDVLQENKLLLPPLPTDFKTLETQVPQLKGRVEANLLSIADFAYIKARYRYHPHESFVKYRLGDDLQARAKTKIDFYRNLFAQSHSQPEDIVKQANTDDELMLLNNAEQNEYRIGYTTAAGLFFTDQHFHDFLFKQKPGVVSEIYTLRSGDNSDYAYLIVYPTNVTVKQYRTVAEVVESKASLFK